MYSLQKKKKAVDLLIKYDYAYRQVIRELGYPNSRTTLTKWNKEVKEMGKLKDCYKKKQNIQTMKRLLLLITI